MPKIFESARTPEAIASVMEARFNSRDVAVALEIFHPESVLVDSTGTMHRGLEAIGNELWKLFRTGLPMRAKQRELIVTGDIALLISDWSFDGVGPDGTVIKTKETATDVMRRGEDGIWRYLIDNPFGTRPRNPA
ncbi:YybH family protein [Burkholderia cenocepacia]|uniref:YybH family protein n=1 Tax=Burkholderia cenocepacia TaxID=95486 RepID=UPI002AB7C190|nr:nuclear transport factor 2 family protein [Burkholderia cenocepacia]